MRLLIGNDIEPSVALKRDVRAWTQRILWFAREGDALVLMCEPDRDFLAYVTALTGVDPSTLRFHVIPGSRNPGRDGERMFDHKALLDPGFVAELRGHVTEADEVTALWPSPALPAFAEQIGLRGRLPGAAFMSQFGGEVANNKANFRAIAAGCGVPIATGSVCRTVAEAEVACAALLRDVPAVMIKKAHCAAGAGNFVVARAQGVCAGHAGGIGVRVLRPGAGALECFLQEKWGWASGRDRFAVIVEEFVEGARSVYAEFDCDEEGQQLEALGELIFEEGALVREEIPLRLDDTSTEGRLIRLGSRLASVYHLLGYRGTLSTDAVLTDTGEVTFTEVNCNVTGSTHLHRVVAREIVDVSREPARTVAQFTTPDHWSMPDLEGFLNVAGDRGLLYDSRARAGWLAVAPMTAEFGTDPAASGRRLLALVYESPAQRAQLIDSLEEAFGATAARLPVRVA
jgi:hypothetical protein